MEESTKTSDKGNKIIFIVGAIVVIILALVVVVLLFNNGDKIYEVGKDINSGDKLYEVGKDIDSGEYVLIATGSFTIGDTTDDNYGYYAVCSDKDCEDILYNNNIQEKAYVIVEDNQYLKISDVKLNKIDDYDTKIKESYSKNYNFGFSTFLKIGKDLKAGTYELSGENLFYQICTKPSCEDSVYDDKNEVIDSGNDKSATVSLENGQYLRVNGKGKITIVRKN